MADIPHGLDGKKVAIVHDWLYGGGAEMVVLELHRLFPEAPIYTSYCSNEWRAKLDDKVVTGYLQRWPFKLLRKVIQILRIQWFESLDFSDFDLVISSSGNGEAKAIKAGSRYRDGQIHVSYCHSPSHFLWRHYETYMANFGLGIFNPLAKLGLKILIKPLRKWDLRAAERPDYFIANSNHIRSDIKKFYDRDATTIFPPVNVDRFRIVDGALQITTARKGFVTVGRQVPQKHTELIVEACSRLRLPLTVLGGGPEHEKLKALAGETVSFIPKDQATDDVVTQAMRSAEAFIFAALDDFGITPIEAMAAGTPVIAYQAGGALDYIKPGVTGAFFAEQTVDSLVETLKTFKPQDYDHAAISRAADRFSVEEFQARMIHFLSDLFTESRRPS